MIHFSKYIRKDIYAIFLFMLSLSCTLSQEKEASRVIPFKDRTTNVLILIDSAKANFSSDPQLSFEYLEKALTSSIQTRNTYTEGLSYQVLGMINQQINQYDLANDYYKKAIQIFETTGKNEELNNTYILYAQSLSKLKMTNQSIAYLNKSLEYFQNINNYKKVYEIKQQLADIYNIAGNNQQALVLYKDVLQEEQKQQNVSGAIHVQQKIGNVYLEESKDKEAINSYDESVQMARKLNDKIILANTLENQGRALRKTKKYEQEREVREELLSINRDENNIPAQVDNTLELGEVYLELEDDKKAEEYILEGLQLSKKTGDLEKQSIALKKLSTVYDRKKDYNKALETYKNYVAMVDKIHLKQKEEIQSSIELYTNLNRKLQRLDMLEKDFELSKKNVELLRQEQDLNSRELKIQRALTYSLLIVLIILTFATFLMYRGSLNKRKANQLLALKSLRSQMNPHFIYNSLNSINNYIAKNNEKAANRYLSSFSRLMRSVMDNSKHDFVPLSSELEIIKLYLELENSRFPEKFDYNMEMNKSIDPDFYSIPPMLIQPFVENAIWHGLRYKENKGFLNINIDQEKKNLKITIEDNGIGRRKSMEMKTKYQKEHKSSGLKNIDNRLNIIFNIFKLKIDVYIEDMDKNSGEGTIVTLKIPKTNNE